MGDVVDFNKLQARGGKGQVYLTLNEVRLFLIKADGMDDHLVALLAVELLKCTLPLFVAENDGSQHENVPDICSVLCCFSLTHELFQFSI